MVSESGRCLLVGREQNTIRLVRRGESGQSWLFTILGLAENGEGGSSVCYLASWGRKRGTLKEFYPIDNTLPGRNRYFSLARDGENQLLPQGEAMAARFYSLCEEFARAYDKLERLKSENRILTNFFPSCQVFWGMTADGRRGSIYIWTPDDKQGESFEAYLRQVRAEPRQQPEHKLYQIVSTLITLTDCIRLLHTAGVLHLDLKPANFLVAYNGDGDINAQNISLFDVNSICLTGDPLRSRGTPGFRSPETAAGRGENRSDLYSIGAMLYYGAVVVPGQTPLYSDGHYPMLEELVGRSRLIQGSTVNSSQVVGYLLTKILKNCLHTDPRHRYAGCEELLEDLHRLQVYLVPGVFNAHLPGEKRLALIDAAPGNVEDALQALLYQHPLCGCVAPEEDIRVLVLGAGDYGQKFMDLCLQAGQLLGHGLRLQAASRDAALDREVYLHYRPDLTRFVEVDGQGAEDLPEPYARLDFVQVKTIEPEKTESIRALLAGDCHYIFISLGDDDRNAALAATVCRLTRGHIPVAYVLQEGEHPAGAQGIPVWVNRPARLPPELERMAFNVHLCWEDQNNPDMRQAYRQFRNPYNHRASVSNALAVFSKLRSLGIVSETPQQAAEEFVEKVLSSEDGGVFRQLVALEHRRWVMEKVTAGWRLPVDSRGAPDYAGCARRGSTGDKRRREHICLLPSTPDAPLRDPDFDWDTPTAADDRLDPLDRMSVELHRQYLRLARQARESADLQSGDLTVLYTLARQAGVDAEKAYHRYLACLRQILAGSRSAAGEWKKYQQDLLLALGDFAESAKKRLELVQKQYQPVLEANLRQDYKGYDTLLVRRIPYILTHQPQPHLAAVFSQDDPLANVASAMVLCPGKLTYLLYLDAEHSVDSIQTTLALLRRRHLDGRVYFLVASPRPQPELAALLQKLRERREITGCRFLRCSGPEEGARKLLRAAADRKPALYDASTPLPGGQRMDGVPGFTFDRRRFTVLHGCEYLRYIHIGAYIRAEDVALLPQFRGERLFRPEFQGEYQALWDLYQEAGQKQWEALCARIGQRYLIEDLLATFRPHNEKRELRHLDFPSNGYGTVCRLVECLRERDVVGPDSRVYSRGADVCRAEVYTDGKTAMILENLLSRHDLLSLPDGMILDTEETNLVVRQDSLRVRNLTLEPAQMAILERLYALNVITVLQTGKGQASFAFTARRVKELLMDGKRIRLVCAYHRAMESGQYDDGACVGDHSCLLIRGMEIFEEEIL